MMSTFSAVNTSLAPESYTRGGEETTPTTPRPNTAGDSNPPPPPRMDDATTPTRANFGALATQRPLPPPGPITPPAVVSEPADSPQRPLPKRGDSMTSSNKRDSDDMDMDSDEDGESGTDGEGSINADGTRSAKKKKSQRFFCTDYPPCNLSFTRSEHLARHIRKHTGERPFQCHCSRRFSRLDNLRQHAQTVHVNEEIPTDSLAATGTRFQRQVRTDRVRPTGNRSRANSGVSQSGPIRGHQRNSLSTSSISSISSNFSQRDDGRRRPPPLVMAADPRGRLPHDNSAALDSPNPYQNYRAASPSGYSTPTSATFSTGQDSPRWGSAIQSPISSHSRTASIYAGHRTPGRRLSVPSAVNPFQSQHGVPVYAQSPLTPQNASNSGLFSPTGSILQSPTSATSGYSYSRRDSTSSAADEAWRRRTWHPETHTNFTSRLMNVTTPGYYEQQYPPRPTQAPGVSLPGISSLTQYLRPITPPPRQPSPMVLDTPSRAPPPPSEQYQRDPYPRHDERLQQPNWDLHRGINRLDIGQPNAAHESASSWASDTSRSLQAQAEQSRSVRFEQSSYPAPRAQEPIANYPPQQQTAHHAALQHHVSAPPITPREHKRHGWYMGPARVHQDPVPQPPPQISQPPNPNRTSPGSSSSDGGGSGGVPTTPGSAFADPNPGIVVSAGYSVDPTHRSIPPNPYASYGVGHPAQGGYASYGGGDMRGGMAMPQHGMGMQGLEEQKSQDPMTRLQALVAVATSEKEATAAY